MIAFGDENRASTSDTNEIYKIIMFYFENI